MDGMRTIRRGRVVLDLVCFVLVGIVCLALPVTACYRSVVSRPSPRNLERELVGELVGQSRTLIVVLMVELQRRPASESVSSALERICRNPDAVSMEHTWPAGAAVWVSSRAEAWLEAMAPNGRPVSADAVVVYCPSPKGGVMMVGVGFDGKGRNQMVASAESRRGDRFIEFAVGRGERGVGEAGGPGLTAEEGSRR